MAPHAVALDGFDPLGADTTTSDTAALSQVFEESKKRDVQNILKSYTGTFDLFSEVLQNSLDAVQARQRIGEAGYSPNIWVYIDIPERIVRFTDNGIGMDEDQFKYCLRPSVSFKKQADLRGHKGVGASFLAYGFNFMRLQSKRDGKQLAVILRQGRQWAEDMSGTIPRPKLEAVEFNVPELGNEASGTSVEIKIGQSAGERPRDLAWLGARTAEQWYDVLRIKTPLQASFGNCGGDFFIGQSLLAQARCQCLHLGTIKAREVFAQPLPDVRAHQRLVAREAERRGDLLEVVDHILRHPQANGCHGAVAL